ncbi:hypothetical protein CIW49_26880 [Mycolicibacterium sp. P1-18]|uniref:lanthionine synthetase LanC family protein n=1 Tax=Mycolicibacterium sp. P1-18 TaxID=2024615 RepID=UPI0011F0F08A|nr:lanthionine synthetase LanC family protein [Mycolicibacterium sp. P1-18]KAA0093672.1 hypothetical protein CIW49_26880 [Mycolicibacterium sp. P1-18]
MHPDFLTIARADLTEAPDDETQLALWLYLRWYTGAVAAKVENAAGNRDFVCALSDSNLTASVWTSNWTVLDRGIDSFTVAKDGIHFRARLDDVRQKSSPTDADCSVRLPGERRAIAPGFYVFFGAQEDPLPAGSPRVRLYWNLSAEGASRFVAAVSRVLNEAYVPFVAKTLSEPAQYYRADAGVVYLAVSDLSEMQSEIITIYRDLEHVLRKGVPLWTKPLRPGLAVACDPGTGASFGQTMCALVARAVIDDVHTAADAIRTAERIAQIEAVLTSAGIDPNRPYLCAAPATIASTVAAFELPATRQRCCSVSVSPVGSRLLQNAAIDIGNFIAKEAIWNRAKTMCNWMSTVLEPPSASGASWTQHAAPMGPWRYEGLAGVTDFFVALHSATGNTRFAQMASGAMRCALHQITRLAVTPKAELMGFHTGLTGVWRTAARLHAQTGFTFDQMPLARVVLAAAGSSWGHSNDWIAGRAGVISALLQLGGQEASDPMVHLAIKLGDELTTALARNDCRPISGMAHGAAGWGVALLQLHSRSRKRRFLDAAREAFLLESNYFDEDTGTWPDLRHGAAEAGVAAAPSAWCVGAPGVAVALGLAARTDTALSARYRALQTRALDSTAQVLTSYGSGTFVDAGMCHGASGLADVLLLAAESPFFGEYRDLATAVCGRMASQWLNTQQLSFGQIDRTNNYSLMLGLPGVGLTLLRASGVKVPSAFV